MIESLNILGVPVHKVTLEEAAGVVEEWLKERVPARWIAMTGSHGVMVAQDSIPFHRVLSSASLSIPDGKWVAWFAGFQAKQKVTHIRGADFVRYTCEKLSSSGCRHFFFGDTEETLALMIGNLRRDFPNLQVAGCNSPAFREISANEDRTICDLISATRPDIVWVGLGLPKQERWICDHLDKIDAKVFVAVGAAFKFIAGRIKPAPRIISASGFEWAWRLLLEPRRMMNRVPRYGARFLWMNAIQTVRSRVIKSLKSEWFGT